MRKFVLSLYIILLACMASIACADVIPDFTFVHISDEHSEAGGATPRTLSDLSNLGPVKMVPYGITSAPPSFIVETGDMTEFGSYYGIDKTYGGMKIPVYPSLGNHDGTWRPLFHELVQAHGAPYYSFDKFGCHFVILDSAGLQDPRPVISPEELEWLKIDLSRAGTSRPVFLGFHHPLGCSEYSGGFETDRLVDILRPYNVVLVMVGHGHSARYDSFDGFDMLEGGSGYGPNPGFQIISIQGQKMHIAYKETGNPDATIGMLEKGLSIRQRTYPIINIQSPKDRSSCAGMLHVKAWIRLGESGVKDACAVIDGKTKVELSKAAGGAFEGKVDTSTLDVGAHYLKASFTGTDGVVYHRSVSFYTDAQPSRVLWRRYMGAGSKSTPVCDEGLVIVGANDGDVRSFDVRTGTPRWRFHTGGAVVCQPIVRSGCVFFGSEDGYLYSISEATGKFLWKFAADDPIYSSPVMDGDSIYFGTRSGGFYSVTARDGRLKWRNADAKYSIECRPFLSGGSVFFGCWDQNVYALDAATGTLRWKCMGQGSIEEPARRYYSPAKCGPVACKGKIYVGDIKSLVSVIDEGTGKIENVFRRVSSVAKSADSEHVYLRCCDGKLTKVDALGKEVWSTPISMDHFIVAPVEYEGTVYACSGKGLLSAVSADTGRVLWQHQVTPSSFVLSSPGVSKDGVVVSATDGTLTMLRR